MAKIKSQHVAKIRHKHKPKGLNSRTFEKVYWPYIPLFLLVILASLTMRAGLVGSVFRHPTSSVLAYASSLSQNDLLNFTNQARRSNSRAPLKLNSELTQAAQAKANDMAKNNYWSHNTPEGNPPWVFVSAQGYQYDKLGENLAAGFADSKSTVNGWMASPEHRENMLDKAYSEVGFGFANNPDYSSTGRDGPMTIVVAYYGQPQVSASTLDRSSKVTLAAAASNLSQTPPPATTSRAQLTLSGTKLASYATMFAATGLGLIGTVWVSRHMLVFRRVLVRGEGYVLHHPMFDFGLILLGLALFALTRTAGFII